MRRGLWAIAIRSVATILVVLASLGAAPRDLNEAGKAAYARGDYAAAERLFSQAIAQAPDDPLLHYHRAVALTRLERWREAARAHPTVLRLGAPPALAAAARDGLRAIEPLLQAPAPRPRAVAEEAIPLRRSRVGWLAEAVVNGSQTAWFLVDTGAGVTVISPRLARNLGLRPAGEARTIELQTLSGSTRGELVGIASLRVGDVEAANVSAVVHETPGEVEGILGNTFLARYVVTLDPARSILTLRPR